MSNRRIGTRHFVVCKRAIYYRHIR